MVWANPERETSGMLDVCMHIHRSAVVRSMSCSPQAGLTKIVCLDIQGQQKIYLHAWFPQFTQQVGWSCFYKFKMNFSILGRDDGFLLAGNQPQLIYRDAWSPITIGTIGQWDCLTGFCCGHHFVLSSSGKDIFHSDISC